MLKVSSKSVPVHFNVFILEAYFPIPMTSGHCGRSVKPADGLTVMFKISLLVTQNLLLSSSLARNHILCEPKEC